MGKPLTELTIKNLKPKNKLYRVSDSGGLCIEVSTKGSKLWRWRYYHNKKQQMLALGKYPAVTLAKARRLRDEARTLVDAGKHPTREKKAQRLRAYHKGEETFERITMHWVEVKRKGLNKKYHDQSIRRLKQHVFPLIGHLPISEITIPDVVHVVESIANRGTIETAKRMKQMISQVFRYASQRGLCEHNPAADLRDILPSRKAKHHACIPINELHELLENIDSYNGKDTTRLALLFLSLTFVRTRELIEARWDEINWDRCEWHIPAEHMKMRRPHLVPLSQQALDILGELKELTGDRERIFYSSASKSKHISNGAILVALRRMGYQGRMTGHGFRALASTILNENGYMPDAIEAQLAHQDDDRSRAPYNRSQYLLERKKMMQDYADIFDKARSGQKGTVIPITQNQKRKEV